MAIRVSWDNPEKTVLYFLFEGRWRISEFDAAIHQMSALSCQVTYPVYSICDMTRCGAPPVGILWQARRAYQMAQENWAGTVIATNNRLVLDLLGSFLNAYAPQTVEKKISVVSTVEEARERLACQYKKCVETP
jgi:hypothetical protein